MLAPPPAADSLAGAERLDHHAAGEFDRGRLPPRSTSCGMRGVAGQVRVVGQFGLDVFQVRWPLLFRGGDGPDVLFPTFDARLQHIAECANGRLRSAARADEVDLAAAMMEVGQFL